MASKDLMPGQWQIGDFVFGSHTLFQVEDVDQMGYDVNVQDFQVQHADELRFGQDSLKPNGIQFIINAIVNRAMDNVAALNPSAVPEMDFSTDPTVGQFAREWKADDIRTQWGEMQPLYFCGRDGSIKRIYGRPSKFAYKKMGMENPTAYQITAEFRRADTLLYNDFEWYAQIRPGEIFRTVRSDDLNSGDGTSWMRFVIIGPAEHPVIQFSDITIDLNIDLDVGDAVEISAYPWSRRIIDADGYSLSPYLTSTYLDRLKFPSNSAISVSWNATGTTASVENVDFSTYGTDVVLPNGTWNVVKYPPTAASELQTDGTNLVLVESGGDDEMSIAIYKIEQTLTDYQRVGFTMDSPMETFVFEDSPVNRVIACSNILGTEYVYADIGINFIEFGTHQSGQDYVLSERFDYPRTCMTIKQFFDDVFNGNVPDNDWTYDLEAGTGDDIRSYTLIINDVVIARFTEDENAVVQSIRDSSHRYTGLGLSATSHLLGTAQNSAGPVSEFHFRDNAPEEIMGSIDASRLFVFWADAWNIL